MNQTEQKIYNFFMEKQINLGETNNVILKRNFVKDGLIDSMNILELIAYLEYEFNLTFDAKALESREFQTIEGIAQIIIGHLKSE